MLVQFRFKNCRSFYEETVLSMQAVKDGELQEINTFPVNARLMPKDDSERQEAGMIVTYKGKKNFFQVLAFLKLM